MCLSSYRRAYSCSYPVAVVPFHVVVGVVLIEFAVDRVDLGCAVGVGPTCVVAVGQACVAAVVEEKHGSFDTVVVVAGAVAFECAVAVVVVEVGTAGASWWGSRCTWKYYSSACD